MDPFPFKDPAIFGAIGGIDGIEGIGIGCGCGRIVTAQHREAEREHEQGNTAIVEHDVTLANVCL